MTRKKAERLIAQAKTLDELRALEPKIEAAQVRNYHVWDKLKNKRVLLGGEP
jgi:predicted  nucleic acid-binding Zn-ribbon protein